MAQSLAAASSGVTATGVTSLVTKEALDGIAWQIAKQMVSSMTKSLVNWINSGFQGSPAFITDLNGFLLDALDTAAGEFIKSLGGIGEFICSPFKLDVQAALSINYAQARSGMPAGPSGPACKLSDIKNNIEEEPYTIRWGPGVQYFPFQRLELRFDLYNTRNFSTEASTKDNWMYLFQTHVWL